MNDFDFDPEDFVKHLMDIAKTDGVVSDDEKNLIAVVEKEIRDYHFALTQALEDGVITRQEKLSLINKRLTFVRKVFDTVQKDMKVTDDEEALLSAVMQKLEDFTKIE